MASSEAQMEKMKLRQNYPNHWHTDLLRATQSDPLFCCFSLWCGPCASYILRERALYNDMSRYTCCGGYMPCSGRCGESHCPELCLCTEVFLCFANSVASTRFMLQDEFNLQTTKCDNCIIGFMFCLQQVACIFSCIACIVGSEELQDASRVLNCFSDMVYCSVCSCMQTQHKVEMDKREGKLGARPTTAPTTVQQMSRLDQPLPPTIGYPPHQQAHAYPPTQQAHAYPPAQQAHAYPPTQQAHAYPPTQQAHAYPPTQQAHAYPPTQQAHAYPPTQQAHAYPPTQQAHAYPPAQQPYGYPPPPQQPPVYPLPAGLSTVKS